MSMMRTIHHLLQTLDPLGFFIKLSFSEYLGGPSPCIPGAAARASPPTRLGWTFNSQPYLFSFLRRGVAALPFRL